MKKWFSFVLLLTSVSASGTSVLPDCTMKGIPLYGKVKVVEYFADFKVQTVTSFPDLNVQIVSAFPSSCGKWQFVDAFPDFTVQFVDAFPDFAIRFTDTFPGL